MNQERLFQEVKDRVKKVYDLPKEEIPLDPKLAYQFGIDIALKSLNEILMKEELEDEQHGMGDN